MKLNFDRCLILRIPMRKEATIPMALIPDKKIPYSSSESPLDVKVLIVSRYQIR